MMLFVLPHPLFSQLIKVTLIFGWTHTFDPTVYIHVLTRNYVNDYKVSVSYINIYRETTDNAEIIQWWKTVATN